MCLLEFSIAKIISVYSSVFMCVRIHVCVCVCVCVISTHMYLHDTLDGGIYIYTYTHIYIHIHRHRCTHKRNVQYFYIQFPSSVYISTYFCDICKSLYCMHVCMKANTHTETYKYVFLDSQLDNIQSKDVCKKHTYVSA
jgi:hypothetical protein